MSEKEAKKWLVEIATTANEKNYTKHMDLISKKVSLQGVPGFSNIGYDEWASQCQHEFKNKLLKSVSYSGFKLLAVTVSQVMFKTFETVEGSDGTVNAQGIEVLLSKEDDGTWRLLQERVQSADETERDNLC